MAGQSSECGLAEASRGRSGSRPETVAVPQKFLDLSRPTPDFSDETRSSEIALTEVHELHSFNTTPTYDPTSNTPSGLIAVPAPLGAPFGRTLPFTLRCSLSPDGPG